MDSTSIYETVLTSRIKFWTMIILQPPSILCSMFVLYHMLRSRTQREQLANHIVIVILIIGLISVSVDLSITLSFLREGFVSSSSPSFCYFWMFMDYSLYANGMLLMAWACIERHVLIFASKVFSTLTRKLFLHYIPIIVCFLYPYIFYSYTILYYKCDQIFNYKQVLCGSPCFKRDAFPLSAYDMLMHSVVPCVLVVAFSLALLLRVVRHKRRTQGHLFSWRKQHRMVVQLLSIACLYIIMNAPPFFVIAVQASLSRTFAVAEYALYFFYLYYFLALLLPFVCLGSLTHLRQKIYSVLKILHCECLMKPSRVHIINHLDDGSIAMRMTTIPTIYVS